MENFADATLRYVSDSDTSEDSDMNASPVETSSVEAKAPSATEKDYVSDSDTSEDSDMNASPVVPNAVEAKAPSATKKVYAMGSNKKLENADMNSSPMTKKLVEDKAPSTSKKGQCRKMAKKPARITTKDRLLKWIDFYGSREFGIWIQCSDMKCGKWRWVREYEESHQVPSLWYCYMNKDSDFNHCSKPESNYIEYEFSQSKFQPGAIVWAQVVGYPSWPGMIEDDPDYADHYQDVKAPRGKIMKKYHVTFLDRTVTRAWVCESSIMDFLPTDKFPELPKKYKVYRKELKKAYDKANLAISMTMAERLEKFSFAKHYTGKWPTVTDTDEEEDEQRDADLQMIFDNTLALMDEVDNLDDLENSHHDEPDRGSTSKVIITTLDKSGEDPMNTSSLISSQGFHKNEQKRKKMKTQNERNDKLVTKNRNNKEVDGAGDSQSQNKYQTTPNQKFTDCKIKETPKRKFKESQKVVPKKLRIFSTSEDIESSINRVIQYSSQNANSNLTVDGNMVMCDEEYSEENNIESDDSFSFPNFEEMDKTALCYENMAGSFSQIRDKVSFIDTEKTEQNMERSCDTVFHCSEESKEIEQFMEVNEEDRINTKTSILDFQKNDVEKKKKVKKSSLDPEEKKKVRKAKDLNIDSEEQKKKLQRGKKMKVNAEKNNDHIVPDSVGEGMKNLGKGKVQEDSEMRATVLISDFEKKKKKTANENLYPEEKKKKKMEGSKKRKAAKTEKDNENPIVVNSDEDLKNPKIDSVEEVNDSTEGDFGEENVKTLVLNSDEKEPNTKNKETKAVFKKGKKNLFLGSDVKINKQKKETKTGKVNENPIPKIRKNKKKTEIDCVEEGETDSMKIPDDDLDGKDCKALVVNCDKKAKNQDNKKAKAMFKKGKSLVVGSTSTMKTKYANSLELVKKDSTKKIENDSSEMNVETVEDKKGDKIASKQNLLKCNKAKIKNTATDFTRKSKGFKPPVIKSKDITSSQINENKIDQLDNANTLTASIHCNQIDRTSSEQAVCIETMNANFDRNFQRADDKQMNFDKENYGEANQINGGQDQVEIEVDANEHPYHPYHATSENHHFSIEKDYERHSDSEDSCPFELNFDDDD